MKVAILTLPNAINYGGMLQALATQQVYKELGHEPKLLDFWFDAEGRRLKWIFSSRRLSEWFYTIAQAIVGYGYWAKGLRHLRTMKLVREEFNLTDWHFCQWSEAPSDLRADLISVGSDQVWNPLVVDDPTVFLLKGATRTIPAITYAASLGQRDFRADLRKEYVEGFRRFLAIGVREKELQTLVEQTGVTAQHVADPTLLVDPSFWRRYVRTKKRGKRRVVVYFLSEDMVKICKDLSRFAHEHDCEIEVLVDTFLLSASKSVRRVIDIWKFKLENFLGPLRMRLAAGPREFVSLVANADVVVSNSFHALMFSTIFRRDVRVVVPNDEGRKGMSARVEEFANGMIKGPLLQGSLESALKSICTNEHVVYDEEGLEALRASSREWLVDVLASIHKRKDGHVRHGV